MSDDLLDQKRNNYLVGIFVSGDQLGMATADLSTGMFRASERAVDDLWEILERVAPAEVLAPESWIKAMKPSLERGCRVHCSRI